MNVVVTGATGFLGVPLVAALRARGETVTAFTRDPARASRVLGNAVECIAWDPHEEHGAWESALARADAVVHLAGESVMARRWTPEVKARVTDSRVLGTRHLVDAVLRAERKPRVFVSASGMDYYGDTADRETREDAAAGSGFLADLCARWEAEAARVASGGVREVRLRLSIVLGETGGALSQIAAPFRWFVGGPVGGTRQWVSWIHRDDAVAVILVALDRDELRGPVNVATRTPVRMREFASAIGRALHRPSWNVVPPFILRIVIGEAGPVLAQSKRLVPAALERIGFTLCYESLDAALTAALQAH